MSVTNDQNKCGQNRSRFPVAECSQRHSIIYFENIGSFFNEFIEWFKGYFLMFSSNSSELSCLKQIFKEEWNRQIIMIENIFVRIKRPYLLEMLNLSSMARVHQSLNAAMCESWRLELNPERRVVLFEKNNPQHRLSPQAIQQEEKQLKLKEKEEISEETLRRRTIRALYEEMGWESLSPPEKRLLSRLQDYAIAATEEEFCKMKTFLETCTIERCVEVASAIDRQETEMEIAKHQSGSSSSKQVVDKEILFVQQQESIKRRQEKLAANQSNLLLEVDEKIQVVENPIDELEQAIQYSLELEQTSPKPPVLLTKVTKKKTRKMQSVEIRRRKEPKITQECTKIEKTTVAQKQQYKDITTTLETFMRIYMSINDKSIMLEQKNLQKAIDTIFGVQDRTRGSHKQYNQKDIRGGLRERLTYASHGAKDKVKPGTGQKILRTLITIPVLPAEEKEVRDWNQKMWGVELYDPTLEASIHGAKGNVKGQRMSRSEESAKQDSTPTPKGKRKKNCSQKR